MRVALFRTALAVYAAAVVCGVSAETSPTPDDQNQNQNDAAAAAAAAAHQAEEKAADADSIVPVNEPLQIIRPTADHTGMEVHHENLHKLANVHDKPIAIVSVVGPYHSGKSFLLNSLLAKNDVFKIGHKTSPQTMGIWLCRTKLKLDISDEESGAKSKFGEKSEDGEKSKVKTENS